MSDAGTTPLRVLVADDSAFNRRAIADLLGQIPGVEVIGKALDGDHALQLTLLEKPDLVTLDLEMPRMDGFTFLRLLMQRQPTPVIVISGRSAKLDVFRALELGAVEFVVKPSGGSPTELALIRDELAWKVEAVRQLRALRVHDRASTTIVRPTTAVDRPWPLDPTPRRVVCIAASTGGPPALVQLFARLPSDLPATFAVAQHMPERFTRTFAERLDKLGGPRVVECDGRIPLRAGLALVGAGGTSLEVSGKGPALVGQMVPGHHDRYLPSADRLFQSAAAAWGPKVIGIVLTGMGDDGTRGAQAIRAAGGMVLAESAESAAIFGMPRSAFQAGHVDEVIPLGSLAERIVRLVREG